MTNNTSQAVTLTPQQKKLVMLSALGGLLEFYDFIIYALFASYLAETFFPTGNPVTSLMATFATFAVGYLIRPIGGIIFGHYGDKAGRKKTFTISILIMAIATFLIGCVPSYESIGMAAPIILVLLRIAQGFSVGGEIPGAITFVSESVPKREGLVTGYIFATLITGIVLGSLVNLLLNHTLEQAQMNTWGWRIPFLVGGVLGWVSYLLRKQLYESPQFLALENSLVTFPLAYLVKNYFRSLIIGTFITALGATVIVLLFLFTPAYLTKLLHYPTKTVADATTLALLVAAILTIIFGYCADKVNKKTLFIVVGLISLLAAYPIFYLYILKQNILAPLFLSALCLAWLFGVIPSMLAELFETKVRYSGVGVTYNLGFGIFGGLTPLIATSLIHFTKLPQSPAYLLIFVAVLGLTAGMFYPRKSEF